MSDPVVAPRATRRRSWSVGRHLGAIVVGVLVVLGAVGGYAAVDTIRRAEREALDASRFQARLAARAVDQELTSVQEQVASVASNPGIGRVFDDPMRCGLVFGDSMVFGGGHIDFLAASGEVACSSLVERGAPAGATFEGETWVESVAQLEPGGAPVVSRPFVDPLTGDLSLAVAAPMVRPPGEPPLGAVAVILPVDRMGAGLGRMLGGPSGYSFAVADRDGSAVLAGSSLSGSGWVVGSHTTDSTSWQVTAGLERSKVLASTYAVLWRVAALAAAVVAVILLSLTIVQRRIARPLRRLTAAIAEASHGSVPVPVKASGPTEIERLAEEFNQMIAVRHSYEVQLAHQALHDSLTGLPNRALLADRLAQALAHAGPDEWVGVIFVDLDQFKLVNDSLGHAVGDEVLIAMAARLAAAVPAGGTVARFGGDEFIMVCEHLTDDHAAASAIAAHLEEIIAVPLEIAGRTMSMTASIGIGLGQSGRQAEDLLQEADTAMYVAKGRGPGRSELFTSALHDRARGRFQIETQLRSALDNDELWLAYQPKIDLASGSIVAVEALMRWDNATLGSVSPATFIPVAEETNLIGPIGEFALATAVEQTARWRAAGFDLAVSVNISAHQVLDDDLPDLVSRVLAASELPPAALVLEVTETALMSDIGKATGVLRRLSALGVGISIDDFGTGYCSMAYLQQFPVTELKIDRTFVKDIATCPSQRALVSAMIAMASALGLDVVAEGVETIEQADELRALTCRLAQGFLFAVPLPAPAMAELLGHSTFVGV